MIIMWSVLCGISMIHFFWRFKVTDNDIFAGCVIGLIVSGVAMFFAWAVQL